MPTELNLEINTILEHPKIQQMIGEIREEKNLKKQEQSAWQMDAAKLRSDQVAGHKQSLKSLIDVYEEKRKELHSLLGDIHVAENELSRLTGQASGILEEVTFRRINLPRLAAPRPGVLPSMDVGATTTEAAVAGFYAAYGKGWPFLGDA